MWPHATIAKPEESRRLRGDGDARDGRGARSAAAVEHEAAQLQGKDEDCRCHRVEHGERRVLLEQPPRHRPRRHDIIGTRAQHSTSTARVREGRASSFIWGILKCNQYTQIIYEGTTCARGSCYTIWISRLFVLPPHAHLGKQPAGRLHDARLRLSYDLELPGLLADRGRCRHRQGEASRPDGLDKTKRRD